MLGGFAPRPEKNRREWGGAPQGPLSRWLRVLGAGQGPAEPSPGPGSRWSKQGRADLVAETVASPGLFLPRPALGISREVPAKDDPCVPRSVRRAQWKQARSQAPPGPLLNATRSSPCLLRLSLLN